MREKIETEADMIQRYVEQMRLLKEQWGEELFNKACQQVMENIELEDKTKK